MDKKLNFSIKRIAIYNSICGTKEHPSAKMVYEKLKDEYPNLSLCTVYRNISLFKEKGLINTVATVNGEERFDADTTPHMHFVCKCCGGVYDVCDDKLTVDSTFLDKYGFKTYNWSISFYGICNKCS